MRRKSCGFPAPLSFEYKVRYPALEVPIEVFPEKDAYIVIGRTIGSVPEYPAKLFKSSLYRHVLISGTTGSGKSYTASTIAKRVSSELGMRVVVVDWHGEHSRLAENYYLVDPFDHPLDFFTGDPSELSIVSGVLELTPPQEYLLEKVLKRVDLAKLGSIETFLDYLEAYPEESSWMRETKLSLHRKLSPLARKNYKRLFKLYDLSNENFQNAFFKAHVPNLLIVDVSRIRDLSVRKLYSAFFIKKMVDAAVALGTPLLIIIEEAQNFLSRNQAVKPICDMLREVRKFNIGIVVVSQSISSLADDVLTNTNTKIIHALKSKADIDVVEESLYLENSILSVIPYLEPGEAVYSTPTLKKSVLIKVE